MHTEARLPVRLMERHGCRQAFRANDCDEDFFNRPSVGERDETPLSVEGTAPEVYQANGGEGLLWLSMSV